MSTLTVTNIKATGETASRAVSGVAAAWVNFNARNTATIRDSLNVASLTDDGTGLHSVNFTNDMNNDDYSVTNSVNGFGVVSGAMTEINSYNISSFAVRGMNPQSSYANTDFETQSCATHGDLA